ncbi:unnamed protein product [Candidula unifasciata]|uniref:Arrestin C-terminal-like domain-containing protein n=1 Tax=Candidula unifasciata TaxID=100452 RepID=A0A8S3YJ27_9EUPU|nr:unnamed protein product [Candidula unifasciata]
MNIYTKRDSNNDKNQRLTLPNGGPKHDQSFDNPAFRNPDLYTISSTLRDVYSDNHLIYRRNNEDSNTETIRNVYSNSGKSSIYIQNFSSLNIPLNLDSSLPYDIGSSLRRGNIPNGQLAFSQTIGRQPAPTAFLKKTHFGTTLKLPYKRLDRTSKFRYTSSKHNSISYFDIETDQGSNYYYQPGENITGTINIIVLKSLEIRYVELVAIGQGQFTKRKSNNGYPQTVRETYLYKEKCIIGASDAHIGSVLTPGQYTSKFRVRLPRDLPSTIHHDDSANDFKLHIRYALKTTYRSRCCCNQVEIQRPMIMFLPCLFYSQINFNVQRSFDLSAIPEAMSPIVHTEQVNLVCTRQEVAEVTLSLDRSVFLAGDDIRLHLEVILPSSQSVKDITCTLQEYVTISPKVEPMIFTLKQTNPGQEQKFVVTIPTHTRMISPYSLGSSQIKIDYFLAVDLRFTPAGGKLSFKVPVGIGPCADPIHVEKITSRKAIPLFNRTIRFPCFSTRSLAESSSSRPSNSRSTASVVVRTKYSNGLFARCFLCCLGAVD